MAFNMGWAIIQIAHLSMIPTLAKNEGDDVELNSIRQVIFLSSVLGLSNKKKQYYEFRETSTLPQLLST